MTGCHNGKAQFAKPDPDIGVSTGVSQAVVGQWEVFAAPGVRNFVEHRSTELDFEPPARAPWPHLRLCHATGEKVAFPQGATHPG